MEIKNESYGSCDIVPLGEPPRTSDISAWRQQLVADTTELRRRNPPMSEALKRRQITI